MSGEQKPKRRRWTEKERAEIIKDFSESGLSAWAYSQKIGITGNTFYKWLKKAEKKPVGFARAEVSPSLLGGSDTIIFPNGLRLSITPTTSAERVAQLAVTLLKV